MSTDEQSQALVDKIRGLPPEKIVEVVDFVDFLRSRLEEDQLTGGWAALARRARRRWADENPY